MAKKQQPIEEPRTEPTPDEIIAEGLQVGLDWIAEKLRVDVRWSALNTATMQNAARRDVDAALAPKPLQLPRPPLVNEPLKTTPPARTRDEVDRGYR